MKYLIKHKLIIPKFAVVLTHLEKSLLRASMT